MIEWWFLKAYKPLTKTYHKEYVDSYPMMKKFTSLVEKTEPTPEGLQEAFEFLQQHADKGECLLQGPLSKKLVNESRKGKHITDAPMQRLILDFDGIELPNMPPTIGDTAERLIVELPEYFHNVSYIAHASSSYGMKPDKVSMHLIFQLTESMNSHAMKLCLMHLNIGMPFFKKRLGLTSTNTSLHYPIDVKLAENARLVYIAPPMFDEANDPFEFDNEARWAITEKTNSTLDLKSNIPSDDMTNANRNALNDLRRQSGLSVKQYKYDQVQTPDGPIAYIKNPDKLEIDFYQDCGDFVRYDVNGGDSHAYWVWKDNPAIMYCFKENENPFSFETADANTYKKHLEQFLSTPTGTSTPPVPYVFFDLETDKGFAFCFDHGRGAFFERPTGRGGENTMRYYMQQNSGVMPDPIPLWNYEFNPLTAVQFDPANGFVNRYDPPEIIMNPVSIEKDAMEIEYGKAKKPFKKYWPTIYKLTWSMCGSSNEEFEHFINWLACVVQFRDKTGTAWFLHGVPGTGKGKFYELVCQPIVGFTYTAMKLTANIEDNFDGWRDRNLLMAIDEFNIWGTANPQGLENKLKNWITEKFPTVRAMRTDQVQVESFNNIMIFSNQFDALRIDKEDRRYNVCPRQEKSLRMIHGKKIDDDIDNLLPDEVAGFAAFLLSYKADRYLARVALDNDAKERIRITSMSPEEDFSAALKEDNLEYFLPILAMPTGGGGEWVMSAKNIMKTIVRGLHLKECELSTEDLCVLYRATFSDRKVSPALFGKKLSKWGLTTERLSRSMKRRFGITLKWKLPDRMSPADIKNMYLDDIDRAVLHEAPPIAKVS